MAQYRKSVMDIGVGPGESRPDYAQQERTQALAVAQQGAAQRAQATLERQRQQQAAAQFREQLSFERARMAQEAMLQSARMAQGDRQFGAELEDRARARALQESLAQLGIQDRALDRQHELGLQQGEFAFRGQEGAANRQLQAAMQNALFADKALDRAQDASQFAAGQQFQGDQRAADRALQELLQGRSLAQDASQFTDRMAFDADSRTFEQALARSRLELERRGQSFQMDQAQAAQEAARQQAVNQFLVEQGIPQKIMSGGNLDEEQKRSLTWFMLTNPDAAARVGDLVNNPELTAAQHKAFYNTGLLGKTGQALKSLLPDFIATDPIHAHQQDLSTRSLFQELGRQTSQREDLRKLQQGPATQPVLPIDSLPVNGAGDVKTALETAARVEALNRMLLQLQSGR